MKKGMTWFFMLTKRQLKKKALYVVLALLAASCFFIKHVADNFSVTMEIGVVNEDDGNVSEMVEKNLYSHRGMISFKRFDSYDELEKAVRTGDVIGGYVIKKNFSENILNGNTDEIIQALSTPGNIAAPAANEIFFSFVMKEISYEELVKDTKNTGLFSEFSDEEIREELRKYYDVNLSDGSTFSIDYNNDMSEYEGKSISIDTYDYISPIIEGIIGLMIFIGGMCGTMNYYDDRKNGSMSLLKNTSKQLTAIMEIAIPVVIITIAGIFILMGTGMENNICEACIKYMIYGIIVILYCFLQKTIIRKKETYVSLVPAFILFSIIFCPVFVNISSMSPDLAALGKVLPLYWLYVL